MPRLRRGGPRDLVAESSKPAFRALVEAESAKADFVPFQPQVSNLG
jgi:hypothetical protein